MRSAPHPAPPPQTRWPTFDAIYDDDGISKLTLGQAVVGEIAKGLDDPVEIAKAIMELYEPRWRDREFTLRKIETGLGLIEFCRRYIGQAGRIRREHARQLDLLTRSFRRENGNGNGASPPPVRRSGHRPVRRLPENPGDECLTLADLIVR